MLTMRFVEVKKNAIPMVVTAENKSRFNDQIVEAGIPSWIVEVGETTLTTIVSTGGGTNYVCHLPLRVLANMKQNVPIRLKSRNGDVLEVFPNQFNGTFEDAYAKCMRVA